LTKDILQNVFKKKWDSEAQTVNPKNSGDRISFPASYHRTANPVAVSKV